jgi:hypothetical protein
MKTFFVYLDKRLWTIELCELTLKTNIWLFRSCFLRKAAKAASLASGEFNATYKK